MPQHAGRRIELGQNRRPAAAQDAGFLRADALAIRAEPVAMIDIHGGDHRDIRIDDVDRVQPAAQADLEDCQIERGLGENQQRRQRAEFEIGQRYRIAWSGAPRGLDALERGDQRRVTGLAPIDPHPFVVTQQMRRSECANSPARCARDRLDEGDRRALAVGAGDTDHARRRPQRIDGAGAQPLHDRAHALEPERDFARMLALLVVQPLDEVHVRIHATVDSMRI